MIVNRYNFWVKTATGSEAAIQLRPSWGYTEVGRVDKSSSRTQGGQLNVYTVVSSWEEFILPVQVSSLVANTIREWWRTKTLVNFTYNSSLSSADAPGYFVVDDAYYGLLDKAYNPLIDGADPKNITCRISNATDPFPANMDAQFDMFDGTLNLSTV